MLMLGVNSNARARTNDAIFLCKNAVAYGRLSSADDA